VVTDDVIDGPPETPMPRAGVGALFSVVHGPTCGRRWSAAAVRAQLRRVAARSGVRRRFVPHQLRHAHAVEMAREGVPLVVIQRQLGHANLGITSGRPALAAVC
jgi:site-specific recombinase XerD